MPGENHKKPPTRVEGKMKKKNYFASSNSLFDLDLVVQIIVDQDTTTILADHDFFVLFYFTLFLRRNRVEATTAGITLHRHHGQAVAVTLANFIITRQQTVINMFPGLGSHFIEMLFFFLRGGDDFLQFSFFRGQHSFLSS